MAVRKKLRIHFKTRTDGIIQLTNCCYGFWYSRSTNRYYYLDPYACNENGKKSSTGRGCLFICSKICDMVHHMNLNKYEGTSGFFIHDIHIETVKELAEEDPSRGFKEDPIWIYLDIHWSYSHRQKKKKKQTEIFWRHYTMEIPNLIYSLWGTIGAFDCKFGSRVGKNQAGICCAILAMQDLCHPSQWCSGILDSAVIYGDCYYAESEKNFDKCCMYQNHFKLQPCLKITPHIWRIKFKTNFCGILYGNMSLADVVKLAFDESSNLLIECNTIVLAVFNKDDDFFVIDTQWIGPPIFQRNHGSIYLLRCKTFDSLIYSLIKILNTNQKLEIRVTPVEINFSQGGRILKDRKEFSTVRQLPGEIRIGGNFIPGSEIVPAVDNYWEFNRNLTLAMKYGDLLENLPIDYLKTEFNEEKLNNFLIRFENDEKIFDDERIVNLKSIKSDCDFGDYPKLVDFVGTSGNSDKNLMRKLNVNKGFTLAKPVDCNEQPSFILEESQNRFNMKTKEMRLRKFKNYKHRIPSDENSGEQDNDNNNKDLGQEETENADD